MPAWAALLIGWDSAFHYFLLMFIPPLFAGIDHGSRSLAGLVGRRYGDVLRSANSRSWWFCRAVAPIIVERFAGCISIQPDCRFSMFSYLALF